MNVGCHPNLGGFVRKKTMMTSTTLILVVLGGFKKQKTTTTSMAFVIMVSKLATLKKIHRGFIGCNIQKNQDDESHSLSCFGR